MAPIAKKSKTLAEQIAELEDPTPKDFDPEDLSDRGHGSDDDESDGGVDASAGREHYEAVGKSNLRKPATIELGKEYKGAKVSRDALYGDESDDDPFRARFFEGEDSEGSVEGEGSGLSGDDSDEEADMEDLEKPATGKPGAYNDSDELEESDVDMDGMDDMDKESESEEEGEEESEMGESEEDEDDDEDEGERHTKRPSDDREELRRLMAADHKTVAASISQAAKADAAKGTAVKRQRVAFDALLNTRIKLQKGLTAANGLQSTGDTDKEVEGESIKAAEAAALSLWNTLEELRHALANAQTTSSKKRKRIAEPTADTPSSEIWNHMCDFESPSFSHRRAVLEKWSRKARGSKASLANTRDKLLNTGNDQQSITAVLDAHVATEIESDRSKGAQETKQQENGTPEVAIYDDTVFYHALLRDLVEQRMAATHGGIADNLHLQLPAQLSINPVTGMRKDKVKRAVDTKASKGRKMRYTVHEKLQDFMVPEDRGSWGDKARTEFFASLLGQSTSAVLGEDENEESALEDEDNLEEGGLRLFRS